MRPGSRAASRCREHSDGHLSGLGFRPTQFNPEARSRFHRRHALRHSMHVPGQYFQTAPEKGDRPVGECILAPPCRPQIIARRSAIPDVEGRTIAGDFDAPPLRVPCPLTGLEAMAEAVSEAI